MVELREITSANLDDVLNLQIFEYQDKFVSSTAHALAQAYVYHETAFPFAIYAGDTLVGFIMLGYYKSRNQYTLWKFLIDKQYQKKGYGKEALMRGIAYLKEKFNVREIYTGVLLGNEIAKHLYKSVGFVETGIIEDNMTEMVCLFSEI
ncbi:MAG: GNAT family N-acetyltransferase [Clostridiales bacterium]|jgi:acetyltransferase, GNAT family|nr:GNAT family N-acetyltransferase [Clostridiales bacterium]